MKKVEIHVQDIMDRYLSIEVDEKMTEEEIKKHIQENFFCRGLNILSDEDGESQTFLYTFTPEGLDADGDEYEEVPFNKDTY